MRLRRRTGGRLARPRGRVRWYVSTGHPLVLDLDPERLSCHGLEIVDSEALFRIRADTADARTGVQQSASRTATWAQEPERLTDARGSANICS